MSFGYEDIERAWALKDPALAEYVVAMASSTDPEPQQPLPEQTPNFDRFLQHIFSAEFRAQPYQQQWQYRVEQIHLLEHSPHLPPRLRLYGLLLLLWSDGSAYARGVLLQIIRDLPLVYGPWKALKHLFKVAEQTDDFQLLAEIAVRVDAARPPPQHAISAPTLTYLRLRAWRYLRRLGAQLPVCYPEAAAHFLAAYPEDTAWADTWIANHIWYHDKQDYGKERFGYVPRNASMLKHRAYGTTWQREPEPLLRLLSVARAERVREYAADALRHDFKVVLREVDVRTLQRLAAVPVESPAIDLLLVWLLKNAPKFEQQQFRQLGLHALVIGLLESPADVAQDYACDYAKVHARDLPTATLVRLADNRQSAIRQLAQQLLLERDPHTVGLAAWGELLDSRYGSSVAGKVLRQHFGRDHLTPDWYRQRLLSGNAHSLQFVRQYLFEMYPLADLGTDYFVDTLNALFTVQEVDVSDAALFALEALNKLGVAGLPVDFLQKALLADLTSAQLVDWINNDVIKANRLPIDFCKALAFEPDWHNHTAIAAWIQQSRQWSSPLSYNADLAETMRNWLGDVRRFSAEALGMSWLIQLVNRAEPEYHEFAVARLIKSFTPADFAPATAAPEPAAAAGGTVDLKGASFLFTGKLATMTRDEAELKVTAALGKNAGGVTAKLDYLVIGDDGSPLYGNGRKGSKQVKAESLIAAGAGIKVISETAFLQMLVGGRKEHSTDQVQAGCAVLWQMAVTDPDTPASKFALRYLRRHHPDICLTETDRPVDPGSEIPAEFLSFARVQPLFEHANAPLRQWALDLARWELARWAPGVGEVLALAESRFGDVRELVHEALLAQPAQPKLHLDASRFPAVGVYRFCESKQPAARKLGMQLIQAHACFQQPEALFPLTESADRHLRFFVVRTLWTLYKRYATTRHWRPTVPVLASIGKKAQQTNAEVIANIGRGLPPRPAQLPAAPADLQELLRRWLYELPPGPPGKSAADKSSGLSASVAKKALIETYRDLAVADAEFAQLVLPLLRNFTRSFGKMEQSACLVAVTRITHAHPALSAGSSSGG